MSRIEPIIEIADRVDNELVRAMERLLPQLSSSLPPSAEELMRIVDSPDTELFLARVGDKIVGSLTLVFYRIPTGLKVWIEDVVVDITARGQGIGRLLNETALETARRRGAKNATLMSRTSRKEANLLYQRMGFHIRDTHVYRYDLS